MDRTVYSHDQCHCDSRSDTKLVEKAVTHKPAAQTFEGRNRCWRLSPLMASMRGSERPGSGANLMSWTPHSDGTAGPLTRTVTRDASRIVTVGRSPCSPHFLHPERWLSFRRSAPECTYRILSSVFFMKITLYRGVRSRGHAMRKRGDNEKGLGASELTL